MRYGYARVSSKTQDYAGQVEQLKAVGCERIFSEKLSAKGGNVRREFERLKKALLPGDVIVVTKLDRLVRSSRDLHNVLHEMAELDCGFVSLREAWCDTTTPVGKLMLTIMGGIAEFERELIRERCEEGIERAKRKGTKFGRPSALDTGQRRMIAQRYAAGETMGRGCAGVLLRRGHDLAGAAIGRDRDIPRYRRGHRGAKIRAFARPLYGREKIV